MKQEDEMFRENMTEEQKAIEEVRGRRPGRRAR